MVRFDWKDSRLRCPDHRCTSGGRQSPTSAMMLPASSRRQSTPIQRSPCFRPPVLCLAGTAACQFRPVQGTRFAQGASPTFTPSPKRVPRGASFASIPDVVALADAAERVLVRDDLGPGGADRANPIDTARRARTFEPVWGVLARILRACAAAGSQEIDTGTTHRAAV